MGTSSNENERRSAPRSGTTSWLDNRWLQLTAGIVAMVVIANLQYGWTLFVEPLRVTFGWREDAIQVGFTLFVLAETWLVPIEGYLVDRYGPRRLVGLGALLVGAAWVVNAVVTTLPMLYAAQTVGGIGVGIVYGASIGNALKWFPDRRGLAAGLTAAGFGAGSALTVVPLANLIKNSGYATAFLCFGIVQGVLVLVCALLMRVPREHRKVRVHQTMIHHARRDFTCREMVRAPVFWLMYVMFTMVSMGGLMAIAQLAPMARDYRVADVEVTVLGGTYLVLHLAMMLDRVVNGLARPFFGWVSDRLGREHTMFVAFGLEGAAILLLINLAHQPMLFVVLSGLTFFAWGEIYSLFPALCGDLFGSKYATTNYGLLYTAKGTAALLVPLGNTLHGLTGGWTWIFLLAVVFDWTAALLALFVLKPTCRRWTAQP
jgi:OFA family oxalate/formate antiporter-like MFS transporter